MFVEFPWKAGIWAKSAENPESLLGLGVHCLVLAEGSQLKQDIFERYLLRAVNRVKGCIINNTTPKGYNWEYETFYVPGQQYLDGVPNSRYRPTHWSSIVDVLQNPEYSKEDYEYARGILPKETFEEQYLGRFTHYSGLVYKDFINKPGIVGSHVVLPYKLDPTWTRILGYDAGANHATAILFGAIKPPRTLVIYDEIHTKGLGISEYAKLIQTKLSAGGVDIKPYAIYLDPSAKQLGIDMALLDIPCTPAENAILPGVERIRNALRLHELEIFNYCEKTIWEVERYVWDRETNKPLKFEDDAMDALRYMFSHPFPKYTTKQDIRNMEHLSQSDRWAWEKALKRREPRKVAPFNAFISEPTYEEEKYAGDKEEFFYPFSA